MCINLNVNILLLKTKGQSSGGEKSFLFDLFMQLCIEELLYITPQEAVDGL